MVEVPLVDLEVILRYSLAIRQETAPARELLSVLDASRAAVEAALRAAGEAPPSSRTPPLAAPVAAWEEADLESPIDDGFDEEPEDDDDLGPSALTVELSHRSSAPAPSAARRPLRSAGGAARGTRAASASFGDDAAFEAADLDDAGFDGAREGDERPAPPPPDPSRRRPLRASGR